MARTFVITGAGAGLGRALARRFAADGHRVVLLGRTPGKVEAAAAEIGENALALACDVSDPASVESAFSAIGERCGRIDVLINNAALFEPFELERGSPEQILAIVLTNLAGTILCSRAALPWMERGGHIVNVSSESVAMPFPHLSVYQATKAGVERFTESLFRELEPRGIRVSCVRAGAMYEEGKVWAVDPEARAAFGRAALERGIDLRSAPISHFASVVEVFRALVDLPEDLHAVLVALHARRP
ncbi:MAG: NAD(P)-dependent oxidoreductase [Porticoccaceae bacterium]|nr:MAG: NAD(P)-dependent oxidoreductase [Porticoccaceae bacterium]